MKLKSFILALGLLVPASFVGATASKSSASITVSSTTGLSGVQATAQVSVISNSVKNVYVTVNGKKLRAGYEFKIGATSTATAVNLAAIIDKLDGIDASSSAGVVYATATTAGTAGNAFTLATSSSTLISVSGAHFSGGLNPGFLTINGITLTEGSEWDVGATTAATATNIAAAINDDAKLSKIIVATASADVVYATSTQEGSNAYSLVSYPTYYLVLSSNVFTSGVNPAGEITRFDSVVAKYFYGDGSGITGSVTEDVADIKVSTGDLATSINAVKVSTGDNAAAISALRVSTGTMVLRAGDTMTGPLTVPAITATYGVSASTGSFTSNVAVATTPASGFTLTVNGDYRVTMTTYTFQAYPTGTSNNVTRSLFDPETGILVICYAWDYTQNLYTYKVTPSTIVALGSVKVDGTNDEGQGNFSPAQMEWVIPGELVAVGLGYHVHYPTNTLHLVSISSVAAPTNVAFKDSTDIFAHWPMDTDLNSAYRFVPESWQRRGNYFFMGFGGKNNVCYSTRTVRIWDISDPYRWRYVAGENMTGGWNANGYANTIQFPKKNVMAVLLEASSGADIAYFDITDIANPVFIRLANNTGYLSEIRGCDKDGNTFICADWDNAVNAMDVSNPYGSFVSLSTGHLDSGNYSLRYADPYILAANETTKGTTGDTSINFEVLDWSDKTAAPVSVFKLFGRTLRINEVHMNGNEILLVEAGTAANIWRLKFNKAVIPFANMGSVKISQVHVTGETYLDGPIKGASSMDLGRGGLFSQGPGSFVGGLSVSSAPTGSVCHYLGAMSSLPTSGYHECDNVYNTTDHTLYIATETVTAAGSWKPVW